MTILFLIFLSLAYQRNQCSGGGGGVRGACAPGPSQQGLHCKIYQEGQTIIQNSQFTKNPASLGWKISLKSPPRPVAPPCCEAPLPPLNRTMAWPSQLYFRSVTMCYPEGYVTAGCLIGLYNIPACLFVLPLSLCQPNQTKLPE